MTAPVSFREKVRFLSLAPWVPWSKYRSAASGVAGTAQLPSWMPSIPCSWEGNHAFSGHLWSLTGSPPSPVQAPLKVGTAVISFAALDAVPSVMGGLHESLVDRQIDCVSHVAG